MEKVIVLKVNMDRMDGYAQRWKIDDNGDPSKTQRIIHLGQQTLKH